MASPRNSRQPPVLCRCSRSVNGNDATCTGTILRQPASMSRHESVAAQLALNACCETRNKRGLRHSLRKCYTLLTAASVRRRNVQVLSKVHMITCECAPTLQNTTNSNSRFWGTSCRASELNQEARFTKTPNIRNADGQSWAKAKLRGSKPS